MSMLNDLTIATARDGLRRGEFSAVELAEAALAAAERADTLNLVVHSRAEMARAAAQKADIRLAEGDAPALCGVPLGIGDDICMKDDSVQAGSRILAGFRPGYSATVGQRLEDAGAIVTGRLNMDEFGVGTTGDSSAHGPAASPWRRDGTQLAAGGSAAAGAVAAGLCLGAVAGDAGGALRQPAAWAGVAGLRPTWGRVSRYGLVAAASSLDQLGPVARSMRDIAVLMDAIAGHDPQDPSSADRPRPDHEAALTGDLRGRVIGIPRECRGDDLPAEMAALWDRGAAMLRDAGAEVRDIGLAHMQYALPVHHVIAAAEASSNLARYDGIRFGHRARLGAGDGIDELYEKSRAEGFGPEVQRRIILGTYVLSADSYEAIYNQTRRIRRLIRADFDAAFDAGVDTILTPVTPVPVPVLGAADDPVERYRAQAFTLPAALAGLPAVAVPAGMDGVGLPLGLQLIGRDWEEAALLDAAFSLERAAGFVARPAHWW